MRQVLSQKRFEGFRVFIWGQNNNKRLIAWKTLFFRRIFILERINLIIMIEFLLQNRIIFIFFLSISNHFTLGSSVVLKATKNNFERRSFSKKNNFVFVNLCYCKDSCSPKLQSNLRNDRESIPDFFLFLLA